MKKPKEAKKGDDPGAENTERSGKRVPAIFYQTEGGREPVREWLKALTGSESERTSRPSSSAGLLECQRVEPWAREFLKTQNTPDEDLALARRNKEKHARGIQ